MADPELPKTKETVRERWKKIAAIDLTAGEPVPDFWSEDSDARYRKLVEPSRKARVPLEMLDVVFYKAAR